MTERFDIAVVGAGLAGLAAARLAARDGARVVVLDPHPVGGRARTDGRDGYLFNRGPHAVYQGGSAERILADLGVALRGGPPDIANAYGSTAVRVGRLPAGPASLATTTLLGFRGKLAAARLLNGLQRHDPAAVAGLTVNEWVDSLRLPPDTAALVHMLVRVSTYANAPDLFSAQVAVEQLQLALGRGVRYVDGGWQTLVDSLAIGLDVRRIAAAAVLRDGADVVVLAAQDQADDPGRTGDPGREGAIVADNAILAVGTPEAAAALVGSAPFEVGPPIEAACWDVGLDTIPERRGMFGIDEPLYASVHCPPARLAPPGHAVVHVARYLAPTDDAAPADQRAELVAHAARLGIGADRVVADRYLHRMTVVGAMPSAAHGGLVGRVAVDATGMPGVHLAGDWVGPEGHLADAALASALVAARRACANVAV